MNLSELKECEVNRLQRLKSHLVLPNYFKKIGIAIFILSFLFVLAVGFFTDGNEVIKTVGKNIILISLLMIVLSREKIEDELIEKLRGQAFTFAFIAGVVYAIFQPYINYLVSVIVRPEKVIFEQLGDFVILWFLLTVYLCFFHLLKRTA